MRRRKKTVMVELSRSFVHHGEDWHELTLVRLADSPGLTVGVTLELSSQPGVEWTVQNVHRCETRPDGTLDHSRCFA